MKQPLVIIAGPTAVGKTSLSIKLAKEINGAVISADSMQVYRGMDIGSAKVKVEEMDGVKHYLIDVLDPKDEFNIVVFQKMAKDALAEIYANGQIPIIAGGTGFYIQSILYDIEFSNEIEDTSFRKEMELFLEENGPSALHEKLKEIDPISYESIHENNTKRVIRALEFYEHNHYPISEHNAKEREKQSPYQYAFFVLIDDREALYERINLRVDQMVDEGLVEEVTRLQNQGCTKSMISMQGLGYKEILDYLDGNKSLSDAIEEVKLETRHFAKRQLTWFRREKEVLWLDRSKYKNDKEMFEYVLTCLKMKKIIDETKE